MASSSRYGEFVWQDLMTTDLEGSKAFYAKLFPEWELLEQPTEMGFTYLKIAVNGVAIGGMVPLEQSHGLPSHWIYYVSVPNCDMNITRAEGLGAHTCVPAFDVPGVGRFAVMNDPSGAVYKPFQTSQPIPAPEPEQLGAFCWHEFHSKGLTASKSFYASLFDWELVDESLSEMGNYTLIHANDKEIGGLMEMPPDAQSPPGWLGYVLVEDVDARCERAAGLGGKVMAGPLDIPNTGRIGVIADPSDGLIAFFSPKA